MDVRWKDGLILWIIDWLAAKVVNKPVCKGALVGGCCLHGDQLSHSDGSQQNELVFKFPHKQYFTAQHVSHVGFPFPAAAKRSSSGALTSSPDPDSAGIIWRKEIIVPNLFIIFSPDCVKLCIWKRKFKLKFSDVSFHFHTQMNYCKLKMKNNWLHLLLIYKKERKNHIRLIKNKHFLSFS